MRSIISRLMDFVLLLYLSVIFLGNFAGILGVIEDADYIRYAMAILLYGYVAILVWWKRGKVDHIHLDRTTLSLLIVNGFIRTRLDVQYEIYFKWIILVFVIMILIACYKYWPAIPKTNLYGLFFALLLSLSIFPIALVESLQPERYSDMDILPGSPGLILTRRLLSYLSFVVLTEEIFFRGILWEFLERLGLQKKQVFWVQGVIFWLGHWWQVGSQITFFITLPLATIMYSVLVRYSKQLIPSVLLHLFLDVFGPILVYFYTQQ